MSGLNPYEWLERYHREQREREAAARAGLAYYAPLLARLGVRTATASFDGQGDEGWVQPAAFHPPPPAGLPDGTADALHQLFSELLPGGWEINAGSFGTITLDTASAAAAVALEHRDEEEFDDDELPPGAA